MKIALFQTKLAWENPEINRTFIEEYFLNEDESFDLFVLPEMFTSGFTMNPSAVAETMEGETMTWLKELAKKKTCAITGSLVIKENDNFYNRMVFVFPSGEVQFYNKRHLFTLAGEEKVYTKDLKHGLTIHPFLEQYGLRSGDNILKIEDKEVEHVSDVTASLLLRDARKLSVQHADGSMEEIVLPEGIDYALFREGAFPAAGLRHQSIEVEKLTVHYPNPKLGTKKSDVLLTVNGNSLKNVDRKAIAKQKSVQLTLLRGKDTVTTIVKGSGIHELWGASSAIEAGLVEDDRFISIGGKSITYFDEIVSQLYHSKRKSIDASILRGKDTVNIKLNVDSTGQIGFASRSVKPEDMAAVQTVHYSFGESIGRGLSKGMTTLSDYVGQLKFLFTKKGASSIGGFGTIGNMFPPIWDWQVFWLTTAFISIILAFMNILPIPALDGGHVVFLIYEIVTGREAPQKVLEYAQYFGFILLISLVLYANGNDIVRWLMGS